MVNKESVTKQTADRLLAILKTNRRSVKWLSDVAGVPYTTLRRQLSGHSSISIGEIAEYAHVLGISPVEILPFDSQSAPAQTVAA